MDTLNLKQAAEFLHIHWVTLTLKARAGSIPGAKIGRRWVFLKIDLEEHIRSQYPRRVLQGDQREKKLCHSINAITHHTGGSSSVIVDARYAEALALKMKPRLVSTKQG